MTASLKGITVVSLEQAVAAPYCSSRLADAGARVIKVERPDGDFARGYDRVVHGESAYFVWLNRGKESLAIDIKEPENAALLHTILAKADVFIQNRASPRLPAIPRGRAVSVFPSRTSHVECTPSPVFLKPSSVGNRPAKAKP